MDVRLKVLVGKNVGQELNVPGPKFFIGRAEDCQLRPRSDLISRHHCVLLVEDAFLAVRDFGSKNGTIVNGERVVGERELKPGDQITIGPLEFEIVVHAPVAAKKRPKVESVKEAAARTAESHNEKLDVSQWLSDSDSQSGDSQVGHAETRVIHMNETGEIDLGSGHAAGNGGHAAGNGGHAASNGHSAKQPEAEMEPVAAQAAATKPEAPKAAAVKSAPGKLPTAPQGSQGDSRAAAADVLNKFFKRR